MTLYSPFPPEKKSALAPRVPVSKKIPTSPNTDIGLVNLKRTFEVRVRGGKFVMYSETEGYRVGVEVEVQAALPPPLSLTRKVIVSPSW